MIEENMNLVYFLVRKYYPTFVTDEDLIQCGMIGLCQAADSWDENLGAFSTFASKCILNEFCREFKRRNKSVSAISLSHKKYDEEGEKSEIGDFIAGDEDVDFFDYESFIKRLSELDKEILKHREFGLTCKEIGEITGYSTSHVNQRLRMIRHLWRKVNGD